MYKINVSFNGRFFFEIGRIAGDTLEDAKRLANEITELYPVCLGYKVELIRVVVTSKRVSMA